MSTVGVVKNLYPQDELPYAVQHGFCDQFLNFIVNFPALLGSDVTTESVSEY